MKLKLLLSLGLAISLVTSAVGGEVRGIRNNNPGNIRKSNIQWKGAIGDDGVFVKFASPEYGIRAMARILRVYNNKYKINTVRGIISRWAPTSENRTDDYVAFVSKKIGKKPDEPIDINNKQELAKLITAIIQKEVGRVPYNHVTILRGIEKQ